MSSIDERIVEMKFNNGQFQKGINQTAESLAKLKDSLNLESAAGGIEQIASKFNWLSVVGATGLMNLTNAAITAGGKIYDATVGQIISGGEKRSQNFAQAKFQLEGLGLAGDQLKGVMEAAKNSVLGTAYGFDEAAVAASSFYASGVTDVPQMEGALRGLAGVTAMTGAEYSSISDIFQKVAGNGRIMGGELVQLGQRGLNVAAEMSKQWGISQEEVRKMASDGEISFAMFSDAMDKAFGPQAKRANELYTGALSNVRAALSRIGEPIADGKFERLRLIFIALIPVIDGVKNAIDPLLQLFKQLQIQSGEAIAGMISGIDPSVFDSFFKNIAWAIKDINAAFKAFGKVAKDIWNEVFPKQETEYGVSILTQIGRAISNFTQSLRPSAQTLATFGAALKIVFTILKMVWEGLKLVGEIAWALIQIIFELAAVVWELIRPLDLTGNVAADSMDSFSSFLEMLIAFRENAVRPLINFLKSLRDGIRGLRDESGSGIPWLDWVYNKLQDMRGILSEGIPKWFETAKSFIMGFFDKLDIKEKFDGVADWIKNIDWAGGMETAGLRVGTAWEWVKDLFKAMAEAFKPLSENFSGFNASVKEVFKNLGEGLKDVDWYAVLQGVGIIGGVAAIVASLHQINKVTGAIDKFADGWATLTTSIGGYLDGIAKAQKFGLTALGILIIAGAIWILADAVIRLSQLSWEEIGKGVAVVGGALVALGGAVFLLSKYMGDKNVIAAAVTMLALAGAMWLVLQVVRQFGSMNYEEFKQGLIGVGLALAGLVGAILLISNFAGDKSVIAASIAMGLIAGSLYAIALAVGIFALFSPKALEQGMTAIMTILLGFSVMAIALGNAGGDFLKAGIAIGIITLALWGLAYVIKDFAAIPANDLAQGGIVVASMLFALTVAAERVGAVGKGALLGATGILIMAGALWIIGDAIQNIGAMSLWDIVKGLGAVAIALGLLVNISNKAKGALPGAFAVLVLSGAIMVLALALKVMETVPIETIVFGLGALILAVGILALIAEGLGKAPQALVGGLIIIGILLAIAGVAVAFGYAAYLIGEAALSIVQAIENLGPALESAGNGLVTFLTTLADNIELLDRLGEWILPLMGMGFAMLILGVGAGVAGIGLFLLAIGLAAIALVGPIAANIMVSMMKTIAELVDYAAPLYIVGGALAFLGLGVLILGVGLIVFALGLASVGLSLFMLAAGIAFIGMTLQGLASAFDAISASGVTFANSIVEIVDILSQLNAWEVLGIAGNLTTLGIALGALGAGAIIGGVGMLILGGGITLVKTSLTGFDKVASKGIAALQKVVDAVAGMVGQSLQLGAMALTFTGLGLALIGMGTGLLLAGAGGMLFATALMLFVALAPGGVNGLNTLGAAFLVFQPKIPIILQAAGAVGKFAADLAAAAMGAGATAAQLETIGGAIERAATAINNFGSAVSGVIPTAIATIETLPAATEGAVSKTQASFDKIAAGVTASTVTIVASVAALTAAIQSNLSAGLNSAASTGYSGGYSVGSQTAAGMAAGIRGGSSGVVNAAISVADRALTAIRNRLDIQSPSREGEEIGMFLDKGIEVGIDKNAKGVEKASYGVANSAVDGMRSALSQMSDLIDGSIDLDPTIRPVMDLTDIKNQASSISGYFGAQKLDLTDSYNSAASIIAEQRRRDEERLLSEDDESRRGDSNFTFNQTLNSPKALSRAEIYRRTKNQASTTVKRIKGELENAR